FFSADRRSFSSTPGRKKSWYSEASPFSVSTGGNSVFAAGRAAAGTVAGGVLVSGATGSGAAVSFAESSLRRDQRDRNGSLSVLTRRLSWRPCQKSRLCV